MVNQQELIEFVKQNPDMKGKDVAEKFQCKIHDVYNARYKAGVSARYTMSKKKGLKVVRKSTLDAKDARIEELENRVEELESSTGSTDSSVRDWKAEFDLAVLHIKKLERILGEHKVVIGYLEQQVYARNSDGASV